uniref:Uncharacterized protein n=1 Tax=Cacopsylla melanoneura TaxID=428564 RepID=A0A8D9E754_9HEMI
MKREIFSMSGNVILYLFINIFPPRIFLQCTYVLYVALSSGICSKFGRKFCVLQSFSKAGWRYNMQLTFQLSIFLDRGMSNIQEWYRVNILRFTSFWTPVLPFYIVLFTPVQF